MTRGDKIGKRYLELRREGNSSKESIDVVKTEFESPDLNGMTIRAYAAKVRQLEPGYQPRRRQPRIDKIDSRRIVLRLLPELGVQFHRECTERRMSPSELLNTILFSRYMR